MQSRMSLWLEIISAVAVVISLIFVGFEIRNSTEQTEQNTRALQVSAYQDLINRIVDMNAIDIEDGTSIESLVGLESRTAQQAQKLNPRIWINFRHGDMAYFQYESGSISEVRMLSAMAPLLDRLEYAPVVKQWNEVKWAFVPAFQSFIDDYLAGNAVDMIPERLRTARLCMRPFVADDGAAVYAYWKSDPGWERFNESVRRGFSLDRMPASFVLEMSGRDRSSQPNWALVHDHSVVGVVSLSFAIDRTVASVGYGIHADLRGRGLCAEAVMKALDCAFSDYPELGEIRAFTHRRK